jgi:hypothetical protein
MLSARLLVSDTDGAGRQTISVAYEALLTGWPKAVAWFETNQEFLRQRNFNRDDIAKHRRKPPRRLDRRDSGKSKSE